MREFRQFGIEVIGAAAPAADVEVIVVGDRFLRERGLRDVTLLPQLDRRRELPPRLPRDDSSPTLEPYRDRLDEDCRRAVLDTNPLRVFDCKVDGRRTSCSPPRSIADHLCDACAAHFAAVRDGLDEAGVAYVLESRLVRGLDYYTRTVFEWYLRGDSRRTRRAR